MVWHWFRKPAGAIPCRFKSCTLRQLGNQNFYIIIIYMMDILKSIAVGLTVGVVFSLFKLPIPAPSVLGGVIGVASIYVGMVLVRYFIK